VTFEVKFVQICVAKSVAMHKSEFEMMFKLLI